MKERIPTRTRADYKVMPWKNGAGSTTELCIEPAAASVQSGFDWRISLAQVPASGPFSSFPDYRRTIMLLRGDPMRLVHAGHGEHELRAWEPYDFHGAWQTEGILSGAPVEDFNVMVRETYGSARVHVQKGSENPVFSPEQGHLHFIYAHHGSTAVELQNEKRELGEGDSILIERASKPFLRLNSKESIAIVVSITRSSFPKESYP